MTTATPSPEIVAHPDTESARLTRWSWAMLPAFAVIWLATGLFSLWALGWFGLVEGDLILMAHSVGAWVLDVVLWVISLSAPVAGVVFAVSALRRGGKWGAWVGLAVNTLLILVVVYGVVNEIHMSYFPGITWLWF
jgi:hypothetical protein